jgi:hypothetical protein
LLRSRRISLINRAGLNWAAAWTVDPKNHTGGIGILECILKGQVDVVGTG